MTYSKVIAINAYLKYSELSLSKTDPFNLIQLSDSNQTFSVQTGWSILEYPQHDIESYHQNRDENCEVKISHSTPHPQPNKSSHTEQESEHSLSRD